MVILVIPRTKNNPILSNIYFFLFIISLKVKGNKIKPANSHL